VAIETRSTAIERHPETAQCDVPAGLVSIRTGRHDGVWSWIRENSDGPFHADDLQRAHLGFAGRLIFFRSFTVLRGKLNVKPL
jgi:hypothetical protein